VVSISFATFDGCRNIITFRSVNCSRTYRLVEDERAASRHSRARGSEHGILSSSGVAEPTSWEAHIERLRISRQNAVHLTEDILDDEISDFRRVHLIGTLIPRPPSTKPFLYSNLLFEEENVLLEMAQTKSRQEEAAMISMTTSVLEDIGQGNSPLVGVYSSAGNFG
jgi:hypothetical protein